MENVHSKKTGAAITTENCHRKDFLQPVKIIVEGPDCAGKTTYAKNLAKSDTTLIHWGIYSGASEVQQVDFCRALINLNMPVVFDRSPISEYVYSKYRGVKPWFGSSDVRELISNTEAQIKFLWAPVKVIVELCKRTQQDSWVLDNIKNIWYDYELLIAAYGSFKNVNVIDNTGVLEGALNDLNSGLRNSADTKASGVSS